MSCVNISEVATKLLDVGVSLEECREAIEPFVDLIIPFDHELSLLTANLAASTKDLGLSLGDRACLALGQKLALTILLRFLNNLPTTAYSLSLPSELKICFF